jgi:hypothetical protein
LQAEAAAKKAAAAAATKAELKTPEAAAKVFAAELKKTEAAAKKAAAAEAKKVDMKKPAAAKVATTQRLLAHCCEPH